METYYKVHGYIAENELLQAIIIYLIAEILKRLLPTKSKEALAEIAGRVVRNFFDKAHIPNKVKPSPESKVLEANPEIKK